MTSLGAVGASTVAYGFTVEPLLRLHVARYNLNPPQWPKELALKVAAIADLHACDPWMTEEHIESIGHLVIADLPLIELARDKQ